MIVSTPAPDFLLQLLLNTHNTIPYHCHVFINSPLSPFSAAHVCIECGALHRSIRNLHPKEE